MIRIMSIIGARPHFMKMAPLAKHMEKDRNVMHIVVHSGQHYDDDLSGQFIKEFQLEEPTYNLGIGSGSANIQIGQFLVRVDDIINHEKPDIILVYGDTNTTSAGAIAAAKRNIPLGHVEAGLREWDKSIPEEVNKLITDAIADLYFCPTESAVQNLKAEGKTDHIILTGDITLDLLFQQGEYLSESDAKSKYHLSNEEFIFFTCHRQNNTDNYQKLSSIIDFLNQSTIPIIWPIHPRTRGALESFNIKCTNHFVKIISPISYWETQNLIRTSRWVITDSGGVTKEAYFHKTPCIVIDAQTEWMEGVREGWTIIAGPHADQIQSSISSFIYPSHHSQAYGNGKASKIILESIYEFLAD